MATNISALQPSGEVLVLEVTPDTRGHELKQQIKQGQPWDKLTRSTTSVEIIVGDTHLLANDEKVLDARIAEDTVVSVVFKANKVICSNKDAVASLGGIIDSELLLVVEIPHDETHIHECAFKGCETLAKVIIPDSVTHIGNLAFSDCKSLAELTIPNSVTYIGVGAFRDCSSLASLTIPDSVTYIGDRAFAGCSSLANLSILNSETHIENGAFEGCNSLPTGHKRRRTGRTEPTTTHSAFVSTQKGTIQPFGGGSGGSGFRHQARGRLWRGAVWGRSKSRFIPNGSENHAGFGGIRVCRAVFKERSERFVK